MNDTQSWKAEYISATNRARVLEQRLERVLAIAKKTRSRETMNFYAFYRMEQKINELERKLRKYES